MGGGRLLAAVTMRRRMAFCAGRKPLGVALVFASTWRRFSLDGGSGRVGWATIAGTAPASSSTAIPASEGQHVVAATNTAKAARIRLPAGLCGWASAAVGSGGRRAFRGGRRLQGAIHRTLMSHRSLSASLAVGPLASSMQLSPPVRVLVAPLGFAKRPAPSSLRAFPRTVNLRSVTAATDERLQPAASAVEHANTVLRRRFRASVWSSVHRAPSVLECSVVSRVRFAGYAALDTTCALQPRTRVAMGGREPPVGLRAPGLRPQWAPPTMAATCC
jgi:hypothetical protein